MRECFVKAETLPEAYHQALLALMREGEVVDCPAWNTRCREIGLTMTVEKPLQEPGLLLLRSEYGATLLQPTLTREKRTSIMP